MRATQLLAIPLMTGTIALATGVFAAAATANIQDDSNILDAIQVHNAADSLPIPLCVFTTTQNASNKAAFDSAVSSRVNQTCPVVIGINPQAHHLAIRMDKYSGLSQSEADSITGQADSAFATSMHSSNDNYTTATVAAVNSMREPLINAHNRGSRVAAEPAHQRHGSFLAFLLPLLLLGAGAFLIARLLLRGSATRRSTMNPGYPSNYQQGAPGYGPQNGPQYSQQYGPAYGYGSRVYGRGGGIGAGMAGIGGGLLGYELGKEMGADRQSREDQSGYANSGNSDNSGGYDNSGGDWTSGQDADFGGGDFGGGMDDSGGGGDW